MNVFADDTKIYTKVDSVEDCKNLQNDLHRIGDLSNRWDLKFNPQKCKILRMGKKNPLFDYSLSDSDGNGILLEVVDKEKTLA